MKRSGRPHVAILTHGGPAADDRHLGDLIRFWGARTSFVDLSTEVPGAGEPAPVVALMFDGLRRLPEADRATFLTRAIRGASQVLIMGLAPGDSLTGEAGFSCRVRALDGDQTTLGVSARRPELVGPLAGARLALKASQRDGLGAVTTDRATDLDAVIEVDGAPVHAVGHWGEATLHLVAARPLALGEPTRDGFVLAERMAEFAPVAMVLRAAFGPALWHVRTPRASIVIDDPALRRRHGHLRLRRLVATLDEIGAAATIAFIPINTARTEPEIAALLREHPTRLGICIHGCFHTHHEFARTDATVCIALAGTASARMDRHALATGVVHDPIMVFPHGAFSRAALRALPPAGLIAAVNTHVHPLDPDHRELVAADHLAPAVIAAQGAPVFARHIASRPLAVFQLQAFLGKPVLIAAHHEIGRDGESRLRSLVAALNRAIPGLQWGSLGQAIRCAGMRRVVHDGQVQCVVLAGAATIANPTPQTCRHVIVHPMVSGLPVPMVEIDGQPVAARVSRGLLVVRTELAPGQTITLRYIDPRSQGRDVRELSTPPLSVARHILCELRDNAFAWLRGDLG